MPPVLQSRWRFGEILHGCSPGGNLATTIVKLLRLERLVPDDAAK
jgi:hypothetical protein